MNYIGILYLPYCFCRANQVPNFVQEDVVYYFAKVFSGAFSSYFQTSIEIIKIMVSLLINPFSFFSYFVIY